jgi:predicted transcriptional regulator
MNTTVRIGEEAHLLLRSLAKEEKRPMLAILEQAIEEYRRRRFLESVNDAYATIRRDDRAWTNLAAERGEWDGALLDGLPDHEQESDPGKDT